MRIPLIEVHVKGIEGQDFFHAKSCLETDNEIVLQVFDGNQFITRIINKENVEAISYNSISYEVENLDEKELIKRYLGIYI